MRVVNRYKTKSKWQVSLDSSGLPCVGYAHYAKATGNTPLDPGVNVLLHGSLILSGTARGRSSAHFTLRSLDGWRAHTTISGAERLFHAVADGRMTMQMDTWNIKSHYEEITAPVFRGYWTLAKQGTEFSLIPAPITIIP